MIIFKATDLIDNMEATVRFTPGHFPHPYQVTVCDLDADEIVASLGETTLSEALQSAVFWATPAETDIDSGATDMPADYRRETTTINPEIRRYFDAAPCCWCDKPATHVLVVAPDWADPCCEDHARKYGCPQCQRSVLDGLMGPAHNASGYCGSGRRPHCTCDTCF